MSAVGEIGRNVLAGRSSGFPVVGEELVEADHWVGADALEDVANVGDRVDMESLAGGDEAGQDGGGLPAFIAPEKESALPSSGNSPQASLRAVVVGLWVSVLALAYESSIPLD